MNIKESFGHICVRMTATFLGIGYSRWAPGTVGSLAGLLLAWCLGPYLLITLIIFLIAGFSACRPATRIFSSGDPQCFVMDEVCGMMIGAGIFPKTLFWYLAAFIIFRLLDIFKPWPISIVQKWSHPSAIMWDDVLAGFFTALGGLVAMAAIYYFTSAAGHA